MNHRPSSLDIASAIEFAFTDNEIVFLSRKRFYESSAAIDFVDGNQVVLTIKEPIAEPLIIDKGTAINLKIVVNRNAMAHIVIMDKKDGAVDLYLSPDAVCTIYILPKGQDAFTSQLTAQIMERAHLRLFEFGASSHQCHRDMNIGLQEKLAQISYFGLDQLHGSQKKRSSLVINHHAKETISAQTFRGLYSGQSLGSFLGQVIIQKDAGQSRARQLYKSTLLSKNAKAHVMPQLAIHNHDINASHGASIGELNPDALFFLRSRGLSMCEAKSLLIRSSTQDVLGHIEHSAIKQALSQWSAKATALLLGEES